MARGFIVFANLLVRLKRGLGLDRPAFSSSREYWQQRYARGKTSGAGSYNQLAQFKAEVINAFVAETAIETVIEFGCGDGNQLGLAHYRHYHGLDISPEAIDRCRSLFATDPTKTFALLDDFDHRQAELVLSLDVIYHLVEDSVFNEYMTLLCATASRYLIIYSSNTDANPGDVAEHVRHRHFSTWLDDKQPAWQLLRHIPNRYPLTSFPKDGSCADFYIYGRKGA